MRGALVGLVTFAAILATPAVGLGVAQESALGIRAAKLRLHRDRGAARDRMKLRARFAPPNGFFTPVSDTLDLLVEGTEVLCVPGSFFFGDPGPYRGPAPLDQTPGARQWTLRERADGVWTYRTDGRRVDIDIWDGTIRVSGRDLDLDVLPGDGPEDVDVTLMLGNVPIGTVIDFEERGRTWLYADE